jgi:hypothetical protein
MLIVDGMNDIRFQYAEELESYATQQGRRGTAAAAVGAMVIAGAQELASHEAPIVEYGGTAIGAAIVVAGAAVVYNSARNILNARRQKNLAQQ